MVENTIIQHTGFHNLADKKDSAKIWGFQFGMITFMYRGMFISQFRTGNITVDGVVYPKKSLIWNIEGIDYMPEEMYDLTETYWPLDAVAYVKVPKPGGLKVGYHEIAIELGWTNCYAAFGPEKEKDGSGLGNAGPMADPNQDYTFISPGGIGTGGRSKRRLLLVW
jgi:hypothetical protein